MGCFDEVLVPCPSCGQEYAMQTKVGWSSLEKIPLREASALMLVDIGNQIVTCGNCGTKFQLTVLVEQTVDVVAP